jgi:hypothetical protein
MALSLIQIKKWNSSKTLTHTDLNKIKLASLFLKLEMITQKIRERKHLHKTQDGSESSH